MIVELCNTDLLRLVNGESVAIGTHVVKGGVERSRIVGSNSGVEIARTLTGKGNARSSKPRRTGVHRIEAKYANKCFSLSCPVRWEKGDPIVYDYDHKRAYCPGHGEAFLPKEATK